MPLGRRETWIYLTGLLAATQMGKMPPLMPLISPELGLSLLAGAIVISLIELGGAHLDAEGYDLLGLICGSEGQLGVVTEATLRILHKPEGARPVLIGFDSNEVAGACVSDIIKAGVLPVAIEFMDRPCIRAADFRHRAVHQYHGHAQQVVGRHPVFQAMRPARVHRDVARDGAGEL